MKIRKKKNANSPKADKTAVPSSPKKTDEITVPSSPKVNTTGFAGWKEKIKGVRGTFRKRAEEVGVPPERVKDFKYWLRENL